MLRAAAIARREGNSGGIARSSQIFLFHFLIKYGIERINAALYPTLADAGGRGHSGVFFTPILVASRDVASRGATSGKEAIMQKQTWFPKRDVDPVATESFLYCGRHVVPWRLDLNRVLGC